MVPDGSPGTGREAGTLVPYMSYGSLPIRDSGFLRIVPSYPLPSEWPRYIESIRPD